MSLYFCVYVCVFFLQVTKHHPVLIKLLCDELKVEPDNILDFELCLADAVPGVSGFLDIFLSVLTFCV